MNERITGTVSRVLSVKGFGFVQGDDGVERYFHVSGLRSESDWPQMREHRRIEFKHQKHARGLRAVDIVFINGDRNAA